MSDYTVPLWIDGKEVVSSTTFDVEDPATLKTLWKCSSASVDDANAAVDAAQRAFPSWRLKKAPEIRTIILKAADIIEARLDELASYQAEETGAPDFIVKSFNLPGTIEMMRDVAGRVSSICGSIPQTSSGGAMVFREPFGVVVGIAPWNGPYILGMRAIVYAIAAGNTAILKGSEMSPRCFWAIGSIFAEAGLPPGVLNVVYHRPQDASAVTNALVERDEVKKVNFTGSTAVGAILAAKCGEHLKPCLLELGGKASSLVLDDADIEHAAFESALGALVHAGQICMSTERIIVHKAIVEPFSKALKAAIEKIYPEGGEAPILVARPAVVKNKKLMKDAVDKGAKLLYGDVTANDDNPHRMRPIVVSEVTKDMDIYYAESFGPTISLLTVDSEDAAVKLANDTEYGLSGAIFTKDLQRGLRLARRIDSGAIHINQMSVHDEATLPHGGAKKSGWGRFNSHYGLDEFLKYKTVTFSGDW